MLQRKYPQDPAGKRRGLRLVCQRPDGTGIWRKILQPGKDAVSEPVKTQFGYHIIKVYGKKDAGTKSFEDVKADLERKLTAQKQQQFMDEMIGKLKKNIPLPF